MAPLFHPTCPTSLSEGELLASVGRSEKESLLRQRGVIVWLYGISGAGKSTLSNALAQRLHAAGRMTMQLDGDALRGGLCKGLGFTDEDRAENLRRAAEVAKLAVESGLVVICSFITPLNSMRRMIEGITGPDDLLSVYVRCPFTVCAMRDPKGLYKVAASNQIKHFTGRDSAFEEPNEDPVLVLNTALDSEEACTNLLWRQVEEWTAPVLDRDSRYASLACADL